MHYKLDWGGGGGGGGINRIQSGSWEFGAGVKQNKGKHWSPKTWKEVTKSNPNQVFTIHG